MGVFSRRCIYTKALYCKSCQGDGTELIVRARRELWGGGFIVESMNGSRAKGSPGVGAYPGFTLGGNVVGACVYMECVSVFACVRVCVYICVYIRACVFVCSCVRACV